MNKAIYRCNVCRVMQWDSDLRDNACCECGGRVNYMTACIPITQDDIEWARQEIETVRQFYPSVSLPLGLSWEEMYGKACMLRKYRAEDIRC